MSCDALLAVLIFQGRVRYLVWFQDHKTDVANLCAAHSTSSKWKQLLLLVELRALEELRRLSTFAEPDERPAKL